MKSLMACLILLGFAVPAMAGDFCNGFERGYIAGYKKAHNTSLEPLTPLCPLEPLKGFGDPDSEFEYGYQIGFLRGMGS
jgi:hypothetical protein